MAKNVIPIPEIQRLSALDAIRQQQIDKLLELHERLADCVKDISDRLKAVEQMAFKTAAREIKPAKLVLLHQKSMRKNRIKPQGEVLCE